MDFENEDIKGIAADEIFVDLLFLFKEKKKEYNKSQVNGNSDLQCQKMYSQYYIAAIDRCLKKCCNNVEADYSDWLRWNHENIIAEFQRYKVDMDSEAINIERIENEIIRILKERYQFNEAEIGEVNEYIHAFESIQDRTEKGKNVEKNRVKHAGRLLINYMNHLVQKCYIESLDQFGYTQNKLKDEVDYLVTLLKENNEYQLSIDVDAVHKQYLEFCEYDKAAEKGQEDVMQRALDMAHHRASENYFECSMRKLKEIKTYIMKKFCERINDCKNVKVILKDAALNPKESVLALIYAVRHPLKTLKSLIAFVKENPLKFGAVVLGALVIGLLPGFAVAGAIYTVDLAISAISIPVASAGAFAVVGSVGTSSVICNVVTAKHVKNYEEGSITLTKEGYYEKAVEAITLENEKPEIMEVNPTADHKTPTAARIEKELDKEMMKQINSMSVEKLNVHREKLNNCMIDIRTEIQNSKVKFETQLAEFKEAQNKFLHIERVKAAAVLFVEEIQEKYRNYEKDERGEQKLEEENPQNGIEQTNDNVNQLQQKLEKLQLEAMECQRKLFEMQKKALNEENGERYSDNSGTEEGSSAITGNTTENDFDNVSETGSFYEIIPKSYESRENLHQLQ